MGTQELLNILHTVLQTIWIISTKQKHAKCNWMFTSEPKNYVNCKQRHLIQISPVYPEDALELVIYKSV